MRRPTSGGGAGLSLHQLETMRRRAAAISSDTPGERLPVPRTGDELQRLGETLNEMLARLEAAIERERSSPMPATSNAPHSRYYAPNSNSPSTKAAQPTNSERRSADPHTRRTVSRNLPKTCC
jgi:HAMP domain